MQKHRTPKLFIAVLGLVVLVNMGFVKTGSAAVILHAFDWKYEDVAAAAPQIAAAGYKAVLVSPPLKTERSGDCPWYKRYQPQDFRVIDGCLGNKEDFKRMIDALTANHVLVYADVVVNHMANERSNATIFPGQETLDQYAGDPSWQNQRLFGDLSVGLFSPQDFHHEFCIQDYGNRDEVIQGRICGSSGDRGLPDLRDTVPGDNWVLDQRREYIKALFELGVRGFRLDAAKHMPVGAIRYFVPDEIAQNAHVFAEIITWGGDRDNEYKLYLKPYLDGLPVSFGAYDFPLLNAIKRAFEFKARLGDYLANPYSDGNALDWQRAVTVVITHDIPYNEGFHGLVMDPKDEELAYAYILGRDGGTPLVFDDGTNKKTYDGRWVGIWKNERMEKMIKFHNRMQGKWMEMLHSDDCVLLWRRQEDGIAAINKCDIDKEIRIGTRDKFKWYVTYREVFTDDDRLRITGEYYRFLIPRRDARMWYTE